MKKVFSMEESIEKMKQMASSMGIVFHPGADDELIEIFEKKMNIKLPEDFRSFYYFSNGTEGDNDMFRMIPLGEIIENSEWEGFEMEPGEIDFAEYIIYSDTWTVSIDKNDHNKYVIYNIGVGDRVDLTNSLAEFLEKYLELGVYDGIFEWREEMKRNRLS